MFQVWTVIRLLSVCYRVAPLLLPCCGDRACHLCHSAAVWLLLPKIVEISILLLCFCGGSETSLCCGDPAWYPNHSRSIREFFLFRPFGGPFGRPWCPRALPGTPFGRPWGSFMAAWGRILAPLGSHWATLGGMLGSLWAR
jgi:hypothetical protein